MGTGAVTLTGNRSIAMASSGSTTVASMTVGGAIGDGGSGFSLTTTGAAVNTILRLTGTNTYTGGTNVNGGLVRFLNAGALPTNGALTIGDNGAVSVSGIYSTLGGWLGDARLSTVTGANAILSLAGGDSIVTFANSNTATWTGSLAITGWSGLATGGDTEQVNFTGGLTTPKQTVGHYVRQS